MDMLLLRKLFLFSSFQFIPTFRELSITVQAMGRERNGIGLKRSVEIHIERVTLQ